jgi:hypothetical protein
MLLTTEAAPSAATRSAPRPSRRANACWSAIALLGLASLALLTAAAAGPSAVAARIPAAPGWPPYHLDLNLPDVAATALAWAAVLLGGAGVLAGLVAVQRGWRPRPWWLLTGAAAVAGALLVTSPVGSNDLLYYAVYGRIAGLGHSPYLLTPAGLRAAGDPVAMALPPGWLHVPSVYGPLATLTEKAAALLAGPSMAKTVFWLKVWDSLAFGAVAVALDRALRHDAAARARAHLLWTANPLMLLACVAGGHVDVLAAACGLAGLLAIRRLDGHRWPVARWMLAGALVAAATAVKAPFALYGVALAWAAWRVRGRPAVKAAAVTAVAAGAVAVLVPCYLLAGWAAVTDLVHKAAGPVLLSGPWSQLASSLQLLAMAASVLLAVILLRGLPGGPAGLPAVRPALALSVAWLAAAPQQRPWFDAMFLPLLALMPATRLDWLLLARGVAAEFGELPGAVIAARLTPGWLAAACHVVSADVRPACVAAATVAVALSGCSRFGQDGRSTDGPRLQSSLAIGSKPLAPGSNPFVRRNTTKPEGDSWACEGRSSSGSRAGAHGTAK